MKNFYTITEQNLRFIIRSILEARSSQHHIGKKLSNIHKFDLKKMSTETLENGAPKYYFSMHDYSGKPQENYGSIKINPNYRWLTPLGVYAYPLTRKFLQEMLTDNLYFLSKAKYVTILTPSDPSKMLILNKKNNLFLSQKINYFKNKDYEEFYYTLNSKEQKDFSKEMNKKIIEEGYNCVFDNGTSAISDMKYEICFLTPNSYKIIEQFTKKDIQDKYLSVKDKEKNVIKKILKLHEKWLVDNGVSGKRFNINELSKYFKKDFLRKINLSGYNLTDSILNGINLSDCYLAYTTLDDCDLQNANLKNSDLIGARLVKSNLYNANLKGANLVSSNFEGANLSNANLTNCNLRFAIFCESNLNGANLSNSNLVYANFNDCNLQNVNLTNCIIDKDNNEYFSDELIKKFNIIVEE